jgi:hypothetical protein
MDSAKVKYFVQKLKDNPDFVKTYHKIALRYKGKIPCCQPLTKESCVDFYDCLWDNECLREIVKAQWQGVINYYSNGALRKIYL